MKAFGRVCRDHAVIPSLSRSRPSTVDQLTAKLTAKPHDTKGPGGMTMDAYTRPELRRRGGQ